MDWLDAIGKIWIDLHKKRMRLKHDGTRITLKYIKTMCPSVHPFHKLNWTKYSKTK
jgi:hypothetical protein